MRIFSLSFLLFFALFGVGCFLQAEEEAPAAEDLIDAEIATVGIDHMTNSPIVLLREQDGGRTVPIWIGVVEAEAIIQGLHNIETPRPMTHDLAVQLLLAAGVEVEEVAVFDVRDGIFYGRIHVRLPESEEVVAVECRPSDALALGVRTGARIRVAEKVLREAPTIDFVPPDAEEQIVQVLGLTVVLATDVLREEMGLAEEVGLIITGVQDPAAELGFRRGDLIFRVNNIVPQSPMEFLEEIMRTEIGRETEVHFWRDGEQEKLKLPAEKIPERTISI